MLVELFLARTSSSPNSNPNPNPNPKSSSSWHHELLFSCLDTVTPSISLPGLLDLTPSPHPSPYQVYPVTHERQIKDLYLEVNKGESVKEIDLPDAIAPKRKSIIDDACERLQQMYTCMPCSCTCAHVQCIACTCTCTYIHVPREIPAL